MTLTILNVIYVLVAIAMIALILMQRGAGAQAGSGFGAGASATVFGAKGAASFLSKTTRWLAIAFFALSLGIGMYVVHGNRGQAADVGIMNEMTQPRSAVPAPAPKAADAAPSSDVPQANPPADGPNPASEPTNQGAPASKQGNEGGAPKPEEKK